MRRARPSHMTLGRTAERRYASQFQSPGARASGLFSRLDPGARGLGGIALLALVLPVGGAAEARALDDLQTEKGALHARRRDVDSEEVEDELLRQAQELLAAHALDLVGEHGSRGG